MEWSTEYPSWGDADRKVKARSGDSELTGTLYYDDWDSDDEGNEWPLWRIRTDSGESQSLFAFDEWMFID